MWPTTSAHCNPTPKLVQPQKLGDEEEQLFISTATMKIQNEKMLSKVRCIANLEEEYKKATLKSTDALKKSLF